MNLSEIESYDVRCLPIYAKYFERMGIGKVLDGELSGKMKVPISAVVKALVLDVLDGRSPIYRISERFEDQDLELLIGDNIKACSLGDDTIGRVLDKIHDYGTMKLFSLISLEVAKEFNLNCSTVHQDTTSVSVWGEYQHEGVGCVNITYGHSKDKRADLKQFIISLLCVENNIPILGSIENGNASDKKINESILSKISNYLSRHGIKREEFVYVADSALVTPTNLKLMHDVYFVTRLPASYSERTRVITEAIESDTWDELGSLAEQVSGGRKKASYRAYESSVSIDSVKYRAVVVYSDLYDKRRLKSIERKVKKDSEQLSKEFKRLAKESFSCQLDALKAASKLCSKYHLVNYEVKEKHRFAKGRPKSDGSRKVLSSSFVLEGSVVPDSLKIEKLKERSGCFVLLTNISNTQNRNAKFLLNTYKEQYGVERNFGFLKDPLIVNDLFLKKQSRVEALGLILILALMLSRLIERQLRSFVQADQAFLLGWNKLKTKKPTTFMMSTKFTSVRLLKHKGKRTLVKEFSDPQKLYLKALDVQILDFLHVH